MPNVNLDHIVNDTSELKFKKIEHGDRDKVLVSHIESPSHLWVQLEKEKGKLDDLLNTMYEYYSAVNDDRLTVNAVKEGSVVAALHLEDESWYRARVVSSEGDMVAVVFMDYGNKENVAVDCLRKLPADFCALPIQVSYTLIL